MILAVYPKESVHDIDVRIVLVSEQVTWHGGDDGARGIGPIDDAQLSQCARVSCFGEFYRGNAWGIEIEYEVERDGCVLGYPTYKDFDPGYDVVFYDILCLEKDCGSCVVWCGQRLLWCACAGTIFCPHLAR